MKDKIRNFPIAFLAPALGMFGFTLSVHKTEQALSLTIHPSNYLLILSIVLFVTALTLYAAKTIYFPHEAKKDFEHPTKINFFPIISICLLLSSVLFLDIEMFTSKLLWITGTTLHLIFTMVIISRWMHHKAFDVTSINPSWFIPAVGNILVPISGVQHASPEISWFFFSIGIVFWVVLFTIVFNRIIFHHPIAEKLFPTFFILIAPPAIGAIAYVKLTGGSFDAFARILYYFSAFIMLLLISQIKYFYKIRFYLSWWSYSFPISAFISSSWMVYQQTGLFTFKALSLLLLTLLSSLIAFLFHKTIKAISRSELCIPEE